MKFATLFLALGAIVGVTGVAQADDMAKVPDPLSDLQKTAGAIVGDAFRRPDPIVKAVSTPGSPAVAAGQAIRTSMEVPGAVFAGILKPLTVVDAALDKAEPPPPPAAAPAPKQRRHRHAQVRHRHMARQG